MQEVTDRAMLNTHQVIKLLALVLMTVDHVGAFLYPDQLWWRAVGRITFPVWFFLVGHALNYRFSRDLLLWALVLVVLSPFLGKEVFPVNALITILCCQLALQQVEKHDWLTRYPAELIAASILFLIPSYLLMEYGVLGFFYALMGYAVRCGQMQWRRGKLVMLVAFGFYVGMMLFAFQFTPAQQIVAVLGTAAVTVYLARFVHRPVAMPRVVVAPLQTLSRWSMQYYVVHRVLFQAVGVMRGVLNPVMRWV
jgi:TraX protein